MSGEGFLSKNISSITGALESVISVERIGRTKGFLQTLDPRVKIFTFVLFIVTIGLLRDWYLLLALLPIIFSLAIFSKIKPGFFIKRVFLFIPVFTLVIALPALFITPGNPLWSSGGHTIVTEQGLLSAVILLLRVTDSLSVSILLVLTTPWNNLMGALRRFRIPAVMVDILSMTYRYIYLLLNNTNMMFLARRSRVLGSLPASENRKWLGRALGVTLMRTSLLSESVYLAMLSRGYRGDIRILDSFEIQQRDWYWLAGVIVAAGALISLSIIL